MVDGIRPSQFSIYIWKKKYMQHMIHNYILSWLQDPKTNSFKNMISYKWLYDDTKIDFQSYSCLFWLQAHFNKNTAYHMHM